MEEKIIRKMMEDCYINGALNKMDTIKMREGYRKDFAIFFTEGEELKKLPLHEWMKMVEAYKQSGDTTGLREFQHEITQIDVTEKAAFVKLKLMRHGVLVFTDLITLLKFEGQWKIATKFYHTHIENPWGL